MTASASPTGAVVIRVWLTATDPVAFVAGFTVRDDVLDPDGERTLDAAATIPDVLARVEDWLRAWLASAASFS